MRATHPAKHDIGVRRHRLIKLTTRQRRYDGQHLRCRQAHVPATVDGGLGESRRPEPRHNKLDVSEVVVRRALFHLSEITL